MNETDDDYQVYFTTFATPDASGQKLTAGANRIAVELLNELL